MPTVITEYLLKTIRYGTSLAVSAEIIDATVFYGYQLYINNSLYAKYTSTAFNFISKPDKKIDILGVSAGEYNFDLSEILDDTSGDKVQIELPSTYRGTVAIYSDNGTGIINYGKRLAEVQATGCDLIGWSDEAQGDFDWGEYTNTNTGGWGHQLFGYSTWGHGTVPFETCTIFTTKRYGSGTYKFALIPISLSDHGQPFIVTKTIDTRPNEIIYGIRSYDISTDTLIIELI